MYIGIKIIIIENSKQVSNEVKIFVKYLTYGRLIRHKNWNTSFTQKFITKKNILSQLAPTLKCFGVWI